MLRRAANLILLLAGPGLLAWGLATVLREPRQVLAVGLLALAGLGLNLTGLLRRTLRLKAWLRVLAVVVGLVALGGVLGARCSTLHTLDSVSRRSVQIRRHLARTACGSPWLAGALAYVILSVAVLPPQPVAGPPKDKGAPGGHQGEQPDGA